MAKPQDAPLRTARPALTRPWQRVLLGLAAAGLLAGLSGLGFTALIGPSPQGEASCGTPPCALLPLPAAEVVMQIPPGSLPEALQPVVPTASLPDEGADVLPGPVPMATNPAPIMPPVPAQPDELAPSGLSSPMVPSSLAMLPLAEVEVAKRPEPKKPRDILFPGEVMKPERQNAAPVMGTYPKPAARPVPPPLKPLRPAEKVPPRPYTTTTTRPTGAVGIRLGPCGPAVPRYQVDGVEVDAFGRPC